MPSTNGSRRCSSTSSRVFWKPGVPCFSFPGMSNPKKIWESEGFYHHLPLCWQDVNFFLCWWGYKYLGLGPISPRFLLCFGFESVRILKVLRFCELIWGAGATGSRWSINVHDLPVLGYEYFIISGQKGMICRMIFIIHVESAQMCTPGYLEMNQFIFLHAGLFTACRPQAPNAVLVSLMSSTR